ncbi:SH3 domain protein [Halobacteriovorax sp. BALOs_7]|uniref:SH3 domain-containing protein n=1 Tax=Halobacteriovorax sp. BALOs_7 TaxID=2109558 RepID=UPI000EA3D560|nr:SH3 domain-containing protein [Halobacteriovorax sp. BALOs_7]AYF45372.1 SH3 domain protein [Halobacteriovorax sp. BALOs_7]
MKEMNNSSTEEFKGNFNFASILDKNEKKIAKSPISNLLQSTTQTVIDREEENTDNSNGKDQLYKKIEELERRFETKEVNEKFERLESLLQSIIINQKSVKEQIEYKPQEEILPTARDNKSIIIASGILSIAIILGAFIYTPSKEIKPAPKQAIKEVITKKEFFTPIKYLNLRSIPSTKGTKLQVVAPNTRVEVLKTDGDWVQIEYRDYLKNTLHTGWVYDQKNLKSI